MTEPFFPSLKAILNIALFLVVSVHFVKAQSPTVDVYRARVVTTMGYSVRGTLQEVDSLSVYVGGDYVPLTMIKKVVVRRAGNKRNQLIGIILGAVAVGFITNQGLQKNPTSSIAAHGLTVGFGAVGGGAAGLLAGSVIGNLRAKVIRPNSLPNAMTGLYRELKPFSTSYQQDLINQLPKSPQPGNRLNQ